VTLDVTRPNVDQALWHYLTVQRWTALQPLLETQLGCAAHVNEGYRYDARQQYLFGQGRTADQLRAMGLDPALARPGPIVTNAWSAKTSAHGYLLDGKPASCALDIVVLGADGKPWTKDDPWDQFVALTTDAGPLASIGLVHFHRPGIAVWDRPHLQLIEYSDHLHTLVV
jgi:hypothetical protein